MEYPGYSAFDECSVVRAELDGGSSPSQSPSIFHFYNRRNNPGRFTNRPPAFYGEFTAVEFMLDKLLQRMGVLPSLDGKESEEFAGAVDWRRNTFRSFNLNPVSCTFDMKMGSHENHLVANFKIALERAIALRNAGQLPDLERGRKDPIDVAINLRDVLERQGGLLPALEHKPLLPSLERFWRSFRGRSTAPRPL